MDNAETKPEFTALIGWWTGSGAWRDLYKVQNVRAMARQLRHYIKIPFGIALLTDELVTAEEAEVDQVLPGTEDPKGLKLFRSRVNCYRRLRYFDPEYTSQFGTPWVMSIDMDTLIRADITDIIEYGMNEFGFCINRAKATKSSSKDHQRPYNGSWYMIKVGEHRHVWDTFDGKTSPKEVAMTRWLGSDQVWIGQKIKGAPTIGPEHGICYLGQYRTKQVVNPRIITCPGSIKPWLKRCRIEAPQVHKEYMRWMA